MYRRSFCIIWTTRILSLVYKSIFGCKNIAANVSVMLISPSSWKFVLFVHSSRIKFNLLISALNICDLTECVGVHSYIYNYIYIYKDDCCFL